MALVLMATHGWGTLFIDPADLEAGVGLQSSFTNPADATAATHYADDTGASPSTGPVTADANGRLMRWIEEGVYTQALPGGATLEVQAVSGTSSAKKPAITPSIQIQYVSENGGSDTADGLSWGSAKKEIQAAIADLPDGGYIFIAPGSYRPTTTLALAGHHLIAHGVSDGYTASSITIQHNFNGNLIEISKGASIKNVYLVNLGDFTGAAIYGAPAFGDSLGSLYFQNIQITSADIGAGQYGFERNIHLDGSALAVGCRRVHIDNVQCFGARTAGENVVLDRVIHVIAKGFEIHQAPESGVTQGLKILDPLSDDHFYNGFKCLGDVVSEAAGSVVMMGRITGPSGYQCQGGSANNHFTGVIENGAFDSNGIASNVAFTQDRIVIGDVVLYRLGANAWAMDDRLILSRAPSDNALSIWRSSNTAMNVTAEGAISWADGAGGGLDSSISRGAAGIVNVADAIGLGVARAAAGVPNNTLFRDSADNKLKFKDNAGTTNALY